MESSIKRGTPNIRALISTVVKYRFFILMMLLFFSGILLMIGANPETHEVIRDLGIGFFVAGTVGLGVEFFVRREMEREFRVLVDETIDDLTSPQFNRIVERIESADQRSHEFQTGISPRVDEIRDLLWNNNLRSMGVRQVHPDREKASFVKWLASAEPGSTVRLMALCLDPSTTHAREKLIRGKLREGCKIRLLLLDPYSVFLNQRAREEAPKAEDAFKERVRTWAEVHYRFVHSLEPELAENFELGFYQAAPTCFIADNEASMLVGFYLHGCRGDDCPHFELEIKPGGAYEQFRNHFESVWTLRLPRPERRKRTQKVEKDRRGLYAVQEPGRETQAV